MVSADDDDDADAAIFGVQIGASGFLTPRWWAIESFKVQTFVNLIFFQKTLRSQLNFTFKIKPVETKSLQLHQINVV